MNRITLNLASRPFRNNTVVGAVLLTVAVAALGATVYNGWLTASYEGRYQELRKSEAKQRERLLALESEERGLQKEIAARNFKSLMGRGHVAGDLILRRAFSWTLLFNKLETVVPGEVMMTAIRPHISGEGIVVRVEGIAKNPLVLGTFYDTLLKNPSFARVDPKSERRLNPSRPEITFVLQFDYVLPPTPVPGPDAVAAGAAEPSASPAPSPAVAASTPAAPRPTPAPQTAIADRNRSAAGSSTGPESVLGTVGRDGQPRTPEVLARLVAAPGGFYPDAPPAPAQEKTAKKPHEGRKPKAVQPPATAADNSGAGVSPGPVSGAASGADRRAAAAPAPAGAPQTAGATSVAPGADPSLARPPAQRQDTGGLPATRGTAAAAAPTRRDPNLGRPMATTRQTKMEPARPAEPIAATRLDLPLSFSARPVREVYDALSRAHGVRFDVDPTVDGAARVTADLGGKNLKDAIATVSRIAGHRVVKVSDGVYRVAPLAGGEPIGDRPVHEESLLDVKP